MMYDELVKALRDPVHSLDCEFCNRKCCYPDGDSDSKCVIIQAAEAIEELQKVVEKEQAFAKCWEEMATDCKERFQKLLDAYPKWIPVTERLPEIHTNVLVMDKAHDMAVGSLEKLWDGEVWVCPFSAVDEEQCPITHWMPLPQPPKEDA